MTTRSDGDRLLEQVLQLPRTYEMTIPPEYMDRNGHMNVMFYTQVGNMALGRFFKYSGLKAELFKEGVRGMFALRQVLSYLNELREGEQIAVHSGLIGHDAKRLHFMHYIISLDKNRIASTDERVAMYIDLQTRRSTPFEPEVVASIEKVMAEYMTLDWQPELSGAIKLKNV